MDPFELLKKDHEAVSKLFDRIEAASGKTKIGIFQQIKSELDLHAHIEETVLYPALEKANETRALTLEAYEEHKVVKELLSELASARTVSDEWKAKLKVLKENVEHHVDEEENELFDKANDVLTAEESERLGDRMQAEKVKRGASPPEPETEKPGLLQKIANTLGLGATPEASNKAAAKPKGTKAKAGRKQAKGARQAKALKKTASAAVKSKGSKSTRTAKRPTKKKAPSKKKAASKSVSGKKKGAVKTAKRSR
jgi:iron-sulfur cluster repair protein YtfE (RIC family)